MPPVDEEQRRFFEMAKHQYPRSSVIAPPIHSVEELARVLDALNGVPLDQPVIDFGAGTGRLTIALARTGYRVLSVDISARSLDVLAQVALELDFADVQTSTSLPAGEVYGAVVGADVLHHVDLDDVLPRLHSLLADDGRIVFTEPGGFNPAWYFLSAFFGRLGVERRIVTCNPWTLPQALRRHGFHNVRITGVGLLPRPLFGWSAAACRFHDRCGNLPLLRWVAYRYLIEATG